MHRHFSFAIGVALGVSVWLAAGASAQSLVPERVMARATISAGRVQGLVRDAAGNGVCGRQRARGRPDRRLGAQRRARPFLARRSPPGDYVLKASRSGYLSNYREPVRVQSTTLLERTITLTKQSDPLVDFIPDDGHAHTDLAWSLRHLTRSVLRDGSDSVPPGAPARGTPGWIDTSRTGSSAGVASPLAAALAGTDFRGQLNFITTTAARPMADWAQDVRGRAAWPTCRSARPSSGYGAWQVRAAVASGDGSSWNMLGEYASEPAQSHNWNLRLSYSAQGYTTHDRSADRGGRRSAHAWPALCGEDRWRVSPRARCRLRRARGAF